MLDDLIEITTEFSDGNLECYFEQIETHINMEVLIAEEIIYKHLDYLRIIEKQVVINNCNNDLALLSIPFCRNSNVSRVLCL